MSISLSVYDVFANLLPGLFYLFAINEFLRTIGERHINLSDVSTTPQVLALLAGGYLLGNLFNSFTYGWYLIFRRQGEENNRNNPKSDAARALETIRKLYPDLKPGFFPRDADLLFNAIQIKNKDLADRIEITRVNAIMMRNISFGLFLLGFTEFINFAAQSLSLIYLVLGTALWIFSYVAIYQTSRYYQWFFRDVFRSAILYGDSLRSVVDQMRKEGKLKGK